MVCKKEKGTIFVDYKWALTFLLFDPVTVLNNFDYCFAENGLTAYRLGEKMASQVCISGNLRSRLLG